MIRSIDGFSPQIAKSAFISEQAGVYGKVEVGEDSSVWPMTVLRGDVANIKIGDGTNIQDNVTVHVSVDIDTVIGNGVTVGHNAVLHSCTIEDNVLVGMGAIILDGAYIERDCIIGAGALVPPGKRILAGSLVLGCPGKIAREVREQEKANNAKNAAEYIVLAAKYASL